MKSIDLIIAGIAVFVVAFSIWYNVRKKRRGESCGCSGCGGRCSSGCSSSGTDDSPTLGP